MKRALRWTGLAVAGLLLLGFLAGVALLATPLGTWAVNRVLPGALPTGLTVDGLSGRLGGELQLDTLRMAGDGFVLEVRDVSLSYSPWGLLLPPRTLQVDAVRAARVELEQVPKTAPASPPSEGAIPLEAPMLPVNVELDAAQVAALRVTSLTGWLAEAQALRVAARWDADGAVIDTLSLSGQVREPEADTDLASFKVSGKATWPSNRQRAADLHVELDGEIEGLPPLRLALDLNGALGQQPEITLTSAAPLAATLHAQVEGLDPSQDLRGDALLELPSAIDLASLDPRLPPASVSGTVAARLQPDLLTLLPSLQLGLQAFNTITNGQRQALIDGTVTVPVDDLASLTVNAEPLAVHFGDDQGVAGRITLRGRASAEQTVDVTARIDDLNPAWLIPGWPGQLNGDVALLAQQLGGNGLPLVQVKALDLQGTLREQAVAVKGRARFDQDGRLSVEDFTASSGEAAFSMDGQITVSPATGWLPRAAQLQTDLEVPALEQVLPRGRGRIHARASLTGDLARPMMDARVEAEALRIDDAFAIDSLAADISVEGRENLTINANTQRLAIGSINIEQIAAEANGSVHQHELTLSITNPEGVLRTRLRGDANLDAIEWNGALSEFSLTALDREWRLVDAPAAELARIALSPSTQSLSPLCLAAPPHPDRLCLSAGLAGEELDARVTLASVALQPWSSLLGLPIRIDASLEGDAYVQRSADALPSLVGNVRLSPGELSLLGNGGDQELEALRWQDVSLDLATSDQTLTVTATADLTDAGRLDAQARMPRTVLGGEVDPAAQEIEAQIKGQLQVPPRMANTLPGLSALTGQATVDLMASGPLGKPRLQGDLTVRDLQADIAAAGIHVQDGELTLTAATDDLRLQASAGTGEGTLQTQARFQRAGSGWRGEVSLDGERVLLMDTPQVRALISPSLRTMVDTAAQSLRLEGEVLVPEAQLRPIDLSNAVRTSSDEVIVGPMAAEPPAAWRTEADLTLRLGDAVSYKGGGFNGNLRGELAVRERPGEVSTGNGELSVADASFSAFGQTLEVNRGRVVFINSPLSNPGLDIQASRTVDEVTVRVDVRGTLREQIITLSSTPALPQADALSYLVVGKPLSELQGGDSDLLSSAARKTGLAGADLLARRVGRRIGLDEFSVESDDTGESAQLVVGKYLSPKLYVRYGLGLFETLNTWLLRYDLSRRWAVETETGAQNSVDVLYSIED